MWEKGEIETGGRTYQYYLHYDRKGKNPSGINGGRILWLVIYRNLITVANYDKGWIKEPVDEDTKRVISSLNGRLNSLR